jgi:hypothetical protein
MRENGVTYTLTGMGQINIQGKNVNIIIINSTYLQPT